MFHSYAAVSDLTLPLLLDVQSSRSPHDFLRGSEHSSAAIPSPRKSTPVRAEEASSQVRGSDGRAVLALVTRLRKKLRATRGWRGGDRGTRGPPMETCPLSGCPIADPSLFRPSSSGHTRNHAQFPPIGQ